MVALEPAKRPLLLGLVGALASLGLNLFVPAGSRWRDGLWAALILVVALSLAWFERRMSVRGQPLAPLRWVALGLAVVAMVRLAWILRRAA